MILLNMQCNIKPITIDHYYAKRIHLIGIGGSGMCGIATVLIQQGYDVTGSDIDKNSETINYLLKLGVKIFFNHCFDNINQVDIVVVSSAISIDNPEVQAAKELNTPIMQRSELLSKLMKNKYSIAIAGTHGKTTTTAILTNIYIESGWDPTFINGGIIKSEGTHARLGHSHYFITEADESDRSLLWLYPTVAIITNIDQDHMNTYRKDLNYLKSTFIKFLHNLPLCGYAVLCIDDPGIRDILPKLNRRIITYGFNENANLFISNYYQYRGVNYFTVCIKNKKKLEVVLNSAPGRHNVLNATAAIAVSIEEGVDEINLLNSMRNFQGTKRRFERLGNYNLESINGRSGSIMIINDYGHHPSELNATVTAIRDGWPNKRLIMIFQPHRFTRTYELFDNFVNILSNADILLILNIYSAGEPPIKGINSQFLSDSINKLRKTQSIFIKSDDFLLKTLTYLLKNNDLILIQGAGTIDRIIFSLFKRGYSLSIE